MDRRRAAGALLALAACVACSTAAPTASNQTALELLEGPTEGCYYNFQHYGEGDRIMTNEPCLNCTCHNRMLMCYLRVCPFTKPIGQDCTIEKRADQCCPIVTCPDVPVDLLTSTSTSSPAEYGATGLGKVDKYGCSINGKYFSEGSKVPPSPNKPCEHCYCIRNMTTCVMQECTLHVDGCTPIYHKDVCCPVRYSCDHQEEDMLLLDDMTTTVRPTPGFLLTTTTMAPVTQMSQDCVHDDQIFADGALIKTEKACEHCYCMKGDIVCVVQECGTPMENEGKNCTSLPPRQGQCCPDTYICEGDEITSDATTGIAFEDLTTISPPRRVEGSGYRNEPDEPYTEISTFEGSGEEQATTLGTSDMFTSQKQTPQIVDDVFTVTEESFRPSISTIEPDKGQNTVPDELAEITPEIHMESKTTQGQDDTTVTQASIIDSVKETETDFKITISDYHRPTETESSISQDDELIMTTGSTHKIDNQSTYKPEVEPEIEKDTATTFISVSDVTTSQSHIEPSSSEATTLFTQEDKYTTAQSVETSEIDEITDSKATTTEIPKEEYEESTKEKQETDTSVSYEKDEEENTPTSTTIKIEAHETTTINPIENEIDEDLPSPGRIPGEGDCLLNGITYQNNTSVPNINNCHSSCKCFSSIVKCEPIICTPPPEHMDNMHDCQPIYDTPDACCPTYVCHSRETIPPESHSQMSGTDSPNTSSEETESECQGDTCQKHETSHLPCNSEDCEAQKTESSSDKTLSLQKPEGCVGTNCLSTDESCADGKCQQPSTSEHICNNENGCQPSEAEPCIGNNCEYDTTVPKDETPACKDSEGCKISDTGEAQKPTDKLDTECTEENCKRKQQSQDEQSLPSECSESNCKTPEVVKDESNVLTTSTSIKDELPLEATTEKIYDNDITKSPEFEEPITEHQFQEITQAEEADKQKTSELSTETANDVTESELDKHVTEVPELYTLSPESHATKIEVTVTETYKEPEPEDHHIIKPESQATEPEKQVTESFEHITKDILTELTTETNIIEHEEHSTKSPIENEASSPPNTSTEVLDTDLQDVDRNKEDATESAIDDFSTEKHEIITEISDIHVTASKATESVKDESDQGLTSEQGESTESPEIQTTQKDTGKFQDDMEITKFEQITEPSITTITDSSTEKHTYDATKEDESTNIVIDEATETPKLVTADHIEEGPSEPQTTKLEESVTNKMYGDSQTEQIITENPNVYTEKTPVDTTQYNILEEEEKESTQTTVQGILNETQDTGIEKTESSLQDQQENTSPPQVEEDTDKERTTKTPVETQEHITSSISSDSYGTQPTVIEELPQTQENLSPEEVQVTSAQPSITESPIETIDQDITLKESSTQYPEVTVTAAQDITSKTVDDTNISDQDFTEVSTRIPDMSFDKATTQVASEVQKDEINAVTSFDVKIEELTSKPETETTISIISDKDEEKSTVAVPVISHSEQTTLAPEVPITKTDDTSLEEIEKQTSETRRVGSEITTTESLIQTGVDSSDNVSLSDKVTISPEPAIDQMEKTSETIMTDAKDHEGLDNTALTSDAADKETVTASIEENVTEEPSIITQPDTSETEKQSPGQVDTMLQEDHVTEDIESNITEKPGEEIQTPTEYPALHETKGENVYTSAPEIVQSTISPSQDTETNYEGQTEVNTTPETVITHEKDHTVSPMSLVTETKERVTTTSSIKSEDDIGSSSIKPEDDSSYIPRDITTQSAIMYSPEKEDTASHDVHEMEPHQPTTPPEMLTPEKEYDSKTLPPVYSDNEKAPEIIPTTATIEYSTAKVEDIHKEEITSPPITVDTKYDIATETLEHLVPTTERQEPGSELQSTDNNVLQEAATVKPFVEASEEFSTEKKQEVPTLYPETPSSITTDISKDKPEPTEQPAQPTSTESKIVETVPDDTSVGYGQEQEISTKDTIAEADEHTMLPELLTTKHVEEQEKETDEFKTSEQETGTSTYDQRLTTENVIYSEQPVSSDEEHPATVLQDKSTETPQVVEIEKDFTTPASERLTTIRESHVPEVHLSTIEILTTESSITGIYEEDHHHHIQTPSPGIETVEPEYFVTEKHEIQEEPATTGLPEVTEKKEEESDKGQEISTILPLRENVPEAPANEQSTESDGLQTITVASPDDQDLISATENVDKQTTEVQGASEKPSYTEKDENENLQTELPIKDVTIEDETVDKTTVHVDLVQVPVETIPVSTEKTVQPESETETAPKEIVTEMYVPLEQGTESSVLKDTESTLMEDIESVPTKIEISASTTETPQIEIATDSSVQKEPEPSIPLETETEVTIPKETDASVPVETEADLAVPVETETETSVHKDTAASLPEVTEPSKETEAVQKETETPERTEPESTTYQQKVENESEVMTTLEPVYSSSETTPYLVELQEHTNKMDEDTSPAVPIDTTKTSELYQTERGDQSLDVVTDKATDEFIHPEHTSETTSMDEDVKLTTEPQEQPVDHSILSTIALEETPEKTEGVTESISISSDSPAPPLSAPAENIPTIASEEQTATPYISSEHEKLTTAGFISETSTDKRELITGTEKSPDLESPHDTAPEDELIPTVVQTTTQSAPIEITTHFSTMHEKVTKPEDKPVESYLPTTAPEAPKPAVSDIQPTDEIPSPDFPPSGTSGYGQEPDYVEEDQAFGPGTCRYGGKVYVSAQQIPRDDPCDFCFCFRSDIICLQQSCPPPIQGCHEEPIQGFCCPRYECPVSMATTLNVTTTTTTTTTTLPPHFLPHAYKGAAQRRGCQIKGHTYKVGDVVRASSGPCLHCTCGGDGQMKCDPKACTPEPMLRQMIAAAVSAKRRR